MAWAEADGIFMRGDQACDGRHRRPGHTICCSRRPSSSLNRRTRTDSTINPTPLSTAVIAVEG